ncbi:MAG: hypothetical protein WD076_08815 [Parvularculaceae bacterium]
MKMRIEAIFGGILALFILAVAILAILPAARGGYDRTYADGASGPSAEFVAGDDPSQLLCECFNEGFRVAGAGVGVMSSEYRTGFEYCRSALSSRGYGTRGGDAWTAGWNARMSGEAYASSCKNWLRRSV